MKDKKESLMDSAKDTMKLGIVSNTGLFAVGSIGKMAGPVAGPVTGIVGAGMTLANVGRMAKTGLSLTNNMSDGYKETHKKSSTSDKIKKILG